MAFDISTIQKGVFGDLRYEILSCTIDSASGNIQTGLQTVYGMAHAGKSMGTYGLMLARNVGSGATSRPGVINVNSGAQGDVFVLLAVGK